MTESSQNTDTKEEPKWLKPFTEYLPLVAFFIVYWKSDLITATKVLIGVTLVTTAISFFIAKKVATMPLVTAGILGFFGGLTILFNDESFIKMKPTVVQIAFAAILWGGLFFNKIFVKAVMGQTMKMPDDVWITFTHRVCIFFLVCAGLNEIVWRTQTTDFWVNFKVFGLTGLTLVFFASQFPMFNKYIEDPKEK
ncbi:MAG: inner membrane-spanning protein YciB [Bdellovibrionales bacterium]